MKNKCFIAIGVSSWLCLGASSLIGADEILFEEGFNDNGEGTRYTVEGGLVSEEADHAANGVSADQTGPVYWARSADVSIVGVPGPTVERRAVISWHHELTADDVTPEAFELLDSTIAWLTREKANLRVLFSPAPMGTGDELIVERLTANGATVTGDVIEDPVPPVSNFDLVIHSSQGANPSRFTNYAVPYLTFNGPDHDDELVGTIGLSETRDIGEITISAPEHPGAGGKTGSFRFFTGEATVDFPGLGVPDGSTVIATYPIVDVPPVNSLADVEAMVAGTVDTVVDEGTIPAADLESGDAGNFSGGNGDNPVPGGPVGSFATVSTGNFTVKTAGTYGIALWVAGGGRLRIDADGNGLDAGDTVITQDEIATVDGLIEGSTSYADVTLAAGDYDFEWVAYSPTAQFGSEVYFTFTAGAGQRDPVDNQEKWAPLADWEAAGIDILPLNLNGEIAVTKYEQPSQIIEERPLIVAINGPDEGGQVFGGGAFIDFEGSGFFAGSGLNKFATEVDPKTLTLNPVDVTGETGLKLKLLLAATTLDFETSDRLDILVDKDNSGSFELLSHFSAPTADDKYFSDGKTDLNIAFQEVTFDLPDGATNLVIKFEAVTTWWNEVVAFDYVRVVKPATFTELWLLGDATNGNQAEFSQEQGLDEAPGSATAQDDDFYFWGVYPAPIGVVTENEPFTNYDRAHVPGDPFNRIHFNLDADSAAADTDLRMTFALCCFGAADAGPSEHDMVFRLNGKEFFSEAGINSDRIIEETVTAGDFDAVEGANTIEIERTGGSDSAWVQYDYVRLEASAGAPVPQPTDGGPVEGELPAGAYPLTATPTGDGLTGYYWLLEPKEIVTSGEPMHKAGDGAAGADNANSGWADANIYNRTNTGQFVATTFDYGGDDLTPIKEWLRDDANTFTGTEGNLDDGAFRMIGYVKVDAAGPQTFTTTSDDGSVVYVNDELVVSNDNGHGNATVSGTVNFPAAGYYPIDIRYFNGDWTNDAGDHGGANFIGDAGFENVVQGLEDVDPLYTPPPGGPDGEGKNIIWISEVETDAGKEFQDLLSGAGHTVTQLLISDPTADEQATLNAADLVVISRKVNSGTYNNQTWDETITAPLILMSPYLSRSNRWVWFEGNGLADETPVSIAADAPDHPIFAGLTITDGVAGPWHTEVDRGTSLATDPVANGGTLIASSPAGSVVAAEWPADTVAVGPRLMFSAGSREPDGTSIGEAGKYNLTADGEQAFLNAIAHMTGDSGTSDGIAGLLGYWRFDEGSGSTVADSSGNGNDGTIIEPGAAWVNDPGLGSVYQSGGGSYVELGSLPVIGVDTDFTWSFWVNAGETDNNNIVFGNRWSPDGTDFAPREFVKFTPRVFEWHVDGAGQNMPGDNSMFVVGEWAHNLVVKTGATLTYYRNGAEIATSEIVSAPANAQPLYLGGQNGAENFTGTFDEVAIFDRALSTDEVTDVYNRGLNGESLAGGAIPPPPPPAPEITGVSKTAAGVALQFPAGTTYDIEYSSDLRTWTLIASDVTGSYSDADAGRNGGPEGFYRGVVK